jgi:fructose-1,6-bisphosphatase/inositol monophosphatase family enzyme
MIQIASEELFHFTINSNIQRNIKKDKSVVTDCDEKIDKKLSQFAERKGFNIISEEGVHQKDIVKSGNYMTIDPIDGTLGYIQYLNHALDSGDIENFGQKDLGPEKDFCLLIGIVENNVAKYGVVYNYITKEKILISTNPDELYRENKVRQYSAENCFYLDQRIGDKIEEKIKAMKDVTSITQAALGLKSTYTIINPHKNALTLHRVQSAGLWDILPSLVAINAFGGEAYDDNGNKIVLNKYIKIPGNGATILKGNKFKFVIDELRK